MDMVAVYGTGLTKVFRTSRLPMTNEPSSDHGLLSFERNATSKMSQYMLSRDGVPFLEGETLTGEGGAVRIPEMSHFPSTSQT